MSSKRLAPPVEVRLALEESRARGLTFSAAWTLAVDHGSLSAGWPHTVRRDWAQALNETRHEWEAAYHREPTRLAGRLDLLAGLGDPDGVTEGTRGVIAA